MRLEKKENLSWGVKVLSELQSVAKSPLPGVVDVWLLNLSCYMGNQILDSQSVTKEWLSHEQGLLTWKLSPLQSSRITVGYLLLPSRSALDTDTLRKPSISFISIHMHSYSLSL